MINKKPLINFIIWTFSLFLICIIGITNVFADSYDGSSFSAQLYDNLGPTLNAVTTNFESSDNFYYGFIGLTANSSGGAWGISSPTPLLANHTYTMSVELYATGCGSVILSTYNRIGVGTSLGNARTSYMNNTYVTENYSYAAASNILQFAFTPSINASHIVFAYSSTSSGNNCTSSLKKVAFQDLGSSGVSETTINNSLNNQTNIINNSITASTNDIINNADANRDAIIDNQNANNDALIENDNANTDKIIEENKKNFNDCHNSINLFNKSNVINGYQTTATITNTGFTANGSWYVTYPFNLSSGTYTINFDKVINSGTTTSQTGQVRLLYSDNTYGSYHNVPYTFDTSKEITSILFYTDSGSSTVNISFNNVMLVEGSSSKDYEPYGEEICVNKLDEQKNAINNLNDSITNDNVDDSDIGDAFDDFNEFLDDNSTITQLITLPVTLYTAILNNLNGTCSPFNLGNLFGTDLILPCINISQYLGNSLWTMIDIIISGFAIYEIAKKFIKVFNNLSSLREGDVIDD